MNKILRVELKNYFKVINKRKKLLDNELEKCKLDVRDISDNIKKKANNRIHKIVKGFLDNAKFNFEKGRDNKGGRIQCNEEGFLECRGWKHKHFYKIHFLGRYNDGDKLLKFMPNGFGEVIRQANEFIKKIDELPTDFKKELGMNVRVIVMDNNKIERGTIKGIKLGKEFEFEDDLYICGDEEDQLYYNDKIFNGCLKLLEMKKRRHKKLLKDIDVYKKQIEKLLGNGYNNILVATRLTE